MYQEREASKLKRRWPWGWLTLLLLSFGLVACGGSSPAPAPLSPTVDTEAIVAQVMAQLEAETANQVTIEPVLFEPTATPPPTATPIVEIEDETGLNSGELEQTLIDLYQRANPAVVYIVVPPLGSGSGFVYQLEGDDNVYIVTNNHVIANGNNYEIIFADGTRQRGELVGADVDSDLAVLRVAELPEGVEPLALAEAEGIDVGQFVIAIGNPFGEQGSMSLGIISALGRSLSSQRDVLGGGRYSLPGVIQTDAPINPGNSGGPLLNLQGEVVGVNSAIASMTGTNSGVGFAIPVQAVHRIVPNLITEGRHDYAFMGVSFASEISLDDQERYGLPSTAGAYILGIAEGSPAEQAGLRGADLNSGRGGDFIIAIDGNPINSFDDLNSYLVFNAQAGQTIDLTILRDGEEISVPLTLGARP